MAKATSLIKAYTLNSIPTDGGFIVSALFDSRSIYSVYEITAYKSIKDVTRSDSGLNFRSDGNRTHLLIEPPSYQLKHVEPVNRDDGRSIPYRFNELNILTGSRNEKIMVAKTLIFLHTAFTILQRDSDYFSFIFHLTPDVYIAMRRFVADSLYNDCNVSKRDASKASELLVETIKGFTIWSD
jgi:hypothetical protein